MSRSPARGGAKAPGGTRGTGERAAPGARGGAGASPATRPRFVLDRCLTELVYRCAEGGCPRDRTCCVGLSVEVSRREVRAIDSLMDEVARLAPALREGEGYANVFIDDDPDLLIDAGDDGACPFLYRTRRHALCSIHTVALETGRSVPAVKPAACRHWPILLVPSGRKIRVTVQPAARSIGCVAPAAELPGAPTVLEAYRAEIAEMCGPEALPPRLRPGASRAKPRGRTRATGR